MSADAALIGGFGKHVDNSAYGASDAILFSVGYADALLELATPLLFSEIVSGDIVAVLNSGAAFDEAAQLMTDGAIGGLATRFEDMLAGALTGNAGSAGFPEIDLAGYVISEFVLTISSFSLLWPGSDPNGDGAWTDLTFDWRIDVYGSEKNDIPLPGAALLFLGGLAAARAMRRFAR